MNLLSSATVLQTDPQSVELQRRFFEFLCEYLLFSLELLSFFLDSSKMARSFTWSARTQWRKTWQTPCLLTFRTCTSSSTISSSQKWWSTGFSVTRRICAKLCTISCSNYTPKPRIPRFSSFLSTSRSIYTSKTKSFYLIILLKILNVGSETWKLTVLEDCLRFLGLLPGLRKSGPSFCKEISCVWSAIKRFSV